MNSGLAHNDLTDETKSANAPRACREAHFTTHDGESLFYRHWPADPAVRRGAVVMLHRGHEHSGRMAHLVDELNLPDFDFFAWDARGHGHSPGVRGYSPGFADSVRDVDTFARHLCEQYGFAFSELAILAQSVGAVLAAAWAHDYAPPVRCLILASPAFSVKLYVPFARPALRLWQGLRGNFFIQSYVKARFLTQDPESQASYDSDPLISRAISSNILLDLFTVSERVVADAYAISTPTLLLISGRDHVVRHAPQHDFFARLGSPIKEKLILEGFLHDTLGERNRAPAVAKVRDFVKCRFAEPYRPFDRRAADRQGFFAEEAERLAAPLPPLSPRGLYWRAGSLAIDLGARLSQGMRIGRDKGFDSGASLDYVYRNVASGAPGAGLIGRLIDRVYLNAIGWRGIRQRKRHIESLMHEAWRRLHETGRALRLLDIAAGQGRYVLDALNGAAAHHALPAPASALLRDYDEDNVEAGRQAIRAAGLDAIARFERGDAFDADALAEIAPKANLAIVSGLYELFDDNTAVRRSLAGVSRAVEAGGYLIYTGQIWHPQLEMIARCLNHADGSAWVMRRRPQEELDQLVADAGFVKLTQRIDPWGIFTVSLARRIDA